MPSSGYSNDFAAGTLASLAWLTALNNVWNLPPILARSRFQPCHYAVEVLGRRCSMHASRTRSSPISWVYAMAASFSSSTPAKLVPAKAGASRSSRGFSRATRSGRIRRSSSASRCASSCSSTTKLNGYCRVAGAGPAKRHDIMAQPLGERADVARQLNCVGLGLPCQFSLGRKGLACARLAGAVDPLKQLLASRGGALGQARQRVGKAFVLLPDVEHLAMAGRLDPGGFPPGA
jgi:hypothetical protein